MIKPRLVTLGARIPSELKRMVSDYCDRNGIKVQFFITEAIREKLDDLGQDALDNTIVDQRQKSPQFTPKNNLTKYIQSRKKSS